MTAVGTVMQGGIHCLKCVDARSAVMPLAEAMSTPNFRVLAIPTAVADAARAAAAEGRPDHRLLTVESDRSAPCRHCLQWAKPGEQVILFPYDAVPKGRPYSETGPIFVHADRCARYAEQAYPAEFRSGRAFRAYNSDQDLIDAHLPDGERSEERRVG